MEALNLQGGEKCGSNRNAKYAGSDEPRVLGTWLPLEKPSPNSRFSATEVPRNPGTRIVDARQKGDKRFEQARHFRERLPPHPGAKGYLS